MAIEKITNSTVLAKWAEIINEINDVTVDNANSIVNSIGSVYSFTQKVDTDGVDPDNSESFDDALNRFKEANPTVVFKKNDVVVVKLVDAANEAVVYEQAAYTHDGNTFVACTGAVDADKVIMRNDIKLAGEYTQVGNLKKSSTTATADYSAKGKSVADILTEMLSKKVQPTITANPSVSAFSLTAPTTTSVEAGTTFASMTYSAGTFEDGKYTNSNTTGATVTNWKVERITDLATTEVANVNGASLVSGSDTNGGDGFQIGDKGGDYNNGKVVSSVKYKATATYGQGNIAKDNLGGDSDPVIRIPAGSKSKETSAVTCYRNFFYGAVSTTDTIDSTYIRNLAKSGKAYASTIKNGVDTPLEITTTADTRRIVIACDATKTGVTKVLEPTFGSDVLSVFGSPKTIAVEGANGYTSIDYKVWVWEQEKAWGEVSTYRVTLG